MSQYECEVRKLKRDLELKKSPFPNSFSGGGKYKKTFSKSREGKNLFDVFLMCKFRWRSGIPAKVAINAMPVVAGAPTCVQGTFSECSVRVFR